MIYLRWQNERGGEWARSEKQGVVDIICFFNNHLSHDQMYFFFYQNKSKLLWKILLQIISIFITLFANFYVFFIVMALLEIVETMTYIRF